MNLQEFVTLTRDEQKDYTFRNRIVCNDGFSMSVQGSEGLYCQPRENSPIFTKMEIGFPSEQEDLIMEFAETPENPTDTVYGYVPVEIIQKVIDKHKGINLDKTFEK